MTPHRFALRVYYEDTDAGGIVYHARYLHFAERARTECLREAGVPHARLVGEFGAMFVVRRAEMEYWRPARVDDALVVLTETEALGGASVRVRQTVQRGQVRLVGLSVQLACVGLATGRPMPIPPPWRAALSAGLAPPGGLDIRADEGEK